MCQYIQKESTFLAKLNRHLNLFQGVTKGLVAVRILSELQEKSIRADFVLCIGDDRSDEDMFEVINQAAATGPVLSPVAEVFACTVGQKPSKAKYYLEDSSEILRMLQGLANFSDSSSSDPRLA